MIGSRPAKPERHAAGSAKLPAACRGQLTAFQRRIVALVAEGMTDGLIARELGLTVRTVQTEVARCRTRLDASNRTALAVTALRRGLIR